ncbi:DNA-directed RNA polymerase [Candidatus Woesearchaeota archaeon]|nr:DNA-directed RNA polymerase [Candidatus Woesearchaeota archaeon]
MFYRTKLKDHIRIPPSAFGSDVKTAIIEQIKKKYDGFISKELGIVIDVSDIGEVSQGIIIHGDGATFHEVVFEVIIFKPELQEVVYGKVKDIAEFGAFLNIGPIDGMIHISQTMDDFVSFTKEKTLSGKETKRVLKIADLCRARIIAISFKELTNPKLGLTMRQQGLGKLEWEKEAPVEKKEETAAKPAPKKEKK